MGVRGRGAEKEEDDGEEKANGGTDPQQPLKGTAYGFKDSYVTHCGRVEWLSAPKIQQSFGVRPKLYFVRPPQHVGRSLGSSILAYFTCTLKYEDEIGEHELLKRKKLP